MTDTLPGLPGIAPEAMTVNGSSSLSTYITDRLLSCTIARSFTQASTLALGLADPRRQMIGGSLLTAANVIDTGATPTQQYQLVQVSKQKDQVTATFEDALIARLRTITGARTVAPGTMTRVDFARKLLYDVGVTLVGPLQHIDLALNPLTRGTSEDPDEDTWTCLTRLAQDVAYRCFSDGQRIWFGPDIWLTELEPAMTISESVPGIDFIDGEFDVGKPTTDLTVSTYDEVWTAGLGACVDVTGLGALSGRYLTAEIGGDMFHKPRTVKLTALQPSLPEPAATETATT